MTSDCVLVIGADGFIGGALVARLAAAGARVVALVEPGRPGGIAADLRDPDRLREVVAGARPGTVFHLAAVTRVTEANLDAAWETNVTGTAHLLDALKGVGTTLVLAGTAEVYGAAPAPFREDQEPQPRSPYGVSKLAAENLVRIAAEKGELAGAVIARLGVVYGPGQAPMMLVPELIAAALRQEPLRTTPGEQTRDLLFIDDAVAGLTAAAGAADRTAPVFNLGTGVAPTVREVIAEIRKLTGHAGAWETTRPHRANEVMDYRLDVARAAAAFGWRAAVDWRAGLARTVAAARE